MKFFHGAKRAGPYFEGWYLKHQNKQGQALAVIPAFHMDRGGHPSASLQVVTRESSWWLEYPYPSFRASSDRFQVQLGESHLGRHGVQLKICQDGLSLQGTLEYGALSALSSDIMGPFRFFAGMQCSHGIISMEHSLKGVLELNGEPMDFSDGTGYIETDRGRSFPSAYLWTQCLWGGPGDGGLMLAVATIPLPVGSFTGCICAIRHHGREYRLATYRGAVIEEWSSAGAAIRQGKYRLTATLLEEGGQPLRAPVEGSMERRIHESLCANVSYCFWCGKDLLFQRTNPCASFEYSDQSSPLDSETTP